MRSCPVPRCGPGLALVAMLLPAACAPAPVRDPGDPLPDERPLRLVESVDAAATRGTRPLLARLFAWSRPFAGESGSSRAFAGQDLRDVLWLRAPGSFRFRLEPAPGDLLRFGAGVPVESGPARFVATVETSGEHVVAVELEVDGTAGWHDATVDLTPWAGRGIVLELANPDGPDGSLAFWGHPRIVRPEEATSPNVVLYLIDTLRADHLGTYGYSRATSPVLDGLGGGGVVFERCYAHDAQTLGSIPSLLTSLHTPTHGVSDFGERIALSVPTLAEAFRGAGYQTASFITNVNAGVLPGLDRGFDTLHDAARSYRDKDALRSLPEEALLRLLDRASEAPFFAYVHTAEPHRPYTPPPPLDSLFDPGYEGEVTGYFEGDEGYGDAARPEDIDHVIALYDGEIVLADRAVGNLLAALDARGLRENTIVLVTSDHGEELHDRGGWNHGQSLHDELMRVPLILSGPGVPAGRRVSEAAQLIDVAPTLLGLAGLPVPDSFQGESLVPLLEGRARERFADRAIYARASRKPSMSAAVRGRYKVIVHDDGSPVELYDIETDPEEFRNLAAERPEIADRMATDVRRWLEEARDRGVAARSRELSAEDEDRLRALGYIP